MFTEMRQEVNWNEENKQIDFSSIYCYCYCLDAIYNNSSSIFLLKDISSLFKYIHVTTDHEILQRITQQISYYWNLFYLNLKDTHIKEEGSHNLSVTLMCLCDILKDCSKISEISNKTFHNFNQLDLAWLQSGTTLNMQSNPKPNGKEQNKA